MSHANSVIMISQKNNFVDNTMSPQKAQFDNHHEINYKAMNQTGTLNN